MSSDKEKSNEDGGNDPLSILGVDSGATFDLIQEARAKRLKEAGEDQLLKARIEASYDALLMVSLKERQEGKVSTAAATASQREVANGEARVKNSDSSILTRASALNPFKSEGSAKTFLPTLSLPNGQGLAIRFSLGLLALVLVFVSPDANLDLILSISTIGLFVSQVKRGRRPLQSLGWSVVLLSIGLILGEFVSQGMVSSSNANVILSGDHIEALTAIFLIWLGSLFLD